MKTEGKASLPAPRDKKSLSSPQVKRSKPIVRPEITKTEITKAEITKTEITKTEITKHSTEGGRKIFEKTPGGNYSIFRDMVEQGGSGADISWIFGLRNPGRPVSAYKKIQTQIQPFNLNYSRSPSKGENKPVKKEVVDFHVNGQSGEFHHLINHRRVYLGNSSLMSFETGLRDYESHKAQEAKQKSSQEKSKGGHSKLGFSPLPYIDRGEFPSIPIPKKKAESLKKSNPFYSKESLVWKEVSLENPKSQLLVSAQDGRENYPQYSLNERPDRPNIEPYIDSMKSNELGNLKWIADLRLNKKRKNHKLKPMKFQEFITPEVAKKAERMKEEAAPLRSPLKV